MRKVGRFCDNVIEAGWLAAVVVVPLFFNIYSQRVFEPDKLSLLRSIALVMAAAWLLRVVDSARTGRRGAGEQPPTTGPTFRRQILRMSPLVLPTLLLVLVYLVSTVTSLDWKVSLLGSYQRLQGTYTTLSYILIFALLLDVLRTRRQLDRLITTMILVSFPIALYGLVQHFGLDPLPWGGNVTTRVASNMGNAIFVAGFLIMIVPLTLSRLFETWKAVVGPLDTRDGLLGGLAFALLAAALLLGMLVGRGQGLLWLRFLALVVGIALQVPIYLLSPGGRRPRVLAISLPLTFAFLVAFSWVLEIFFPPTEGFSVSRYFWLGMLAVLLFTLAMAAFAYYLRRPISRLLLLAAYFVILIAQLVCVFYTQSRGPLLGLLAGVFAYFAVWGIIRRKTWLTWLMGALAVPVVVFLIMFNTVQSPLMERLREMPYVGRLGKVLQTEEGTGKVRVLIWEGAIDLISPHPPLESPGEDGGPDGLNALRPLIGYGPESMYVAYNRFYPPDLAHYEKRNASPDRSHNETFDALVMSGAVGFLVYMFLFCSVFYYCLRWLGLLRRRWQPLAFVGLWIGGGVAGAVGCWLWRGPVYIGVGIPGGVLAGLALYILIALIDFSSQPGDTPPLPSPEMGGLVSPARRETGHDVEVAWSGDRPQTEYSLLILALFAALVAHFAEIHFGIAIAATRTYFWAFSAMLVVIGTRLATEGAKLTQVPIDSGTAQDVASKALDTGSGGRSGNRSQPSSLQPPTSKEATGKSAGRAGGSLPARAAAGVGGGRLAARQGWLGEVLLWSLIALLILCTMLFNTLTVQEGASILDTIWQSLARNDGQPSPAMLVVWLATWAMIGLVALGALATQGGSKTEETKDWLTAIGLFGLTTLGGALLFAILHAVRLRPVTITSPDAPNPLANTITFYYLFILLGVAGLAALLALTSRRASAAQPASHELPRRQGTRPSGRSRPTRQAEAAATTKVAQSPWASGPVVPVAAVILMAALGILIYLSNISIVRADILYKQGLGSEKAQQWDGAIFFYEKAVALAKDQDFYYLFLGKAYMEKGLASSGQEREAWLTKARDALLHARQIAPLNTDHSANLGRLYRAWGELSTGNQRAEKLQTASQYYLDATSLSPHNAQLYNEWGQVYVDREEYDQAQEAYQHSLSLDSEYVQTYLLLGQLHSARQEWDQAAQSYQQAIQLSPNSLQPYLYLGQLYMAQNDLDRALQVYQQAIQASPRSADAYGALGYVYSQQGDLEAARQAYEKAVELQPKSFINRKNLAVLYQRLGRTSEAIQQAQEALDLAPADQRQAIQAFLDQLGAGQTSGLTEEESQRVDQLLAEGKTHLEAEEWAAAESAYLEVLALDAGNLEAHDALGYVYARQGRLDEAIEEHLFVIEQLPDDYYSHKNLALLYQQKGDLLKAVAAAEKALSLAPEADRMALQAFLEQLRQAQGAQTAPASRAGDISPEQRTNLYAAAPPLSIDRDGSYRATIVTDKGRIVIDLAADKAPQTVNNFVFLANEGFYDGLTFHRVENQPGFALIQGGDPAGNGRGGPGYTVPAEIGLPHDEGAIAMARLGDQANPERASSGSQFYICLVPIHQLDGAYTVFGYVVEGLEVAKQIAAGDKILTIEISER